MKRLILIVTISLSFISALDYEPSAYGAGDIDSSSPYGLTPTERNVLNNRKEIQELKNRVEEQQNRIEGLITIIDGLNKEILSLKEQLKNTQENLEQIRSSSENNKTREMLLQLSQLVEQINNNYVTFDDLRNELNKQTINQTTTNLDIASIYKRGVEAFSNRNYNLAKEYFQKALQQNYKLASTYFYLGEIAFYNQNYSEAIDYYKRSASIYDKASYMKYLYLHTAISLKNIGDTQKANEFFRFIIDTYPNTKVAQVARENLM